MTCFVNSVPKFLPDLTTFPILNVPPPHQAPSPFSIQTLETSQSHHSVTHLPCSKPSPGALVPSPPSLS